MLRANGYSIVYVHQEIYRWREAYFRDHALVEHINAQRGRGRFIYDDDHYRLEKISVIHAVLRR